MSLRLELAPSAPFAALILALHAAAALAAFLVVRGPAGAALAALLVALGAAAAWSRALLRAPRSVRALEIGEGSLVLELRSGQRIHAEPPARCYVSRLAVALPLALLPFRRTLLVSADMLEPGQFRRLRLWALWRRLPAVAGKQLAS